MPNLVLKGRGGQRASLSMISIALDQYYNNTTHVLTTIFLLFLLFFRNNNYSVSGAIDHYTKCIKGLEGRGEGQSDLAIKAHSNRAACYKQISNFDGVIEDCTAVLEVDPDNVKALVRRAQAFEGVERYRFALQDIRSVLTMPRDKVGKANVDMCNMMQHRLNKTVQKLKAGGC